MSRELLLDLAADGHGVPLGADLILRQHPDADAVLDDGSRLGAVVAAAAEHFHTPLAFPVMDLRLEKMELLEYFDVAAGEIDRFQFSTPPTAEQRREYARLAGMATPGVRAAAALKALHYIRKHTHLLPIGMCIGPFSLTTKLMADPIVAVYLAGTGAADEPEVSLLEACLDLACTCVFTQVQRQIAAGAQAIFIAEPAANQIYFSPRQLADGSGIFEHCVLGPNRRLAELMARHKVELMFHCCGEITDTMLDGFCRLHPALLSLGSSRQLWTDAARVPKDVVLYGNVPSKLFYSDQLMPLPRVAEIARELSERMVEAGHPFILGTECDTLYVPEYAATIRAKVDCLFGTPRRGPARHGAAA